MVRGSHRYPHSVTLNHPGPLDLSRPVMTALRGHSPATQTNSLVHNIPPFEGDPPSRTAAPDSPALPAPLAPPAPSTQQASSSIPISDPQVPLPIYPPRSFSPTATRVSGSLPSARDREGSQLLENTMSQLPYMLIKCVLPGVY
jgi:hypothetical protein